MMIGIKFNSLSKQGNFGMNNQCFVFDYKFDVELLKSKYIEFKDKMVKLDPEDDMEKMWGIFNPSFSYMDELREKFGFNFYPMLNYTQKGSSIDIHKDDVSECSILVDLNDTEQSPITYVNDDGSFTHYYYKQCLANGKVDHAVFNLKNDRYTLKLCIDDIPFQRAKEQIIKRINC